MALTRSQYIAGDSTQGAVLTGQVQGVKSGSGVTIGADGTISVDTATLTGLIKTNNAAAFNSYVWPGSAGTVGQLLSIDGSGNLLWTSPAPGGVTQITAGTNISITPAGGTGNVTINSTAAGGLVAIDSIAGSFNGVTTTFTLQSGGSNITATQSTLIIAIGGIIQTPGIAFTYNAVTAQITFTGAPPAGASFAGWTVG